MPTGIRVKPEDISGAIVESLKEYTEDVKDRIFAAVDKVAAEVSDEIKGHVTFKQVTGQYVKSFAKKSYKNNLYDRKYIWYVKPPHHARAHLLEKGHALKGGGRARAFPHIKYGEELAQKRLPEEIEKAIKGAG